MNIEQYIRAKQVRTQTEAAVRPRCQQCRKPCTTCYCSEVKPFVSDPTFLILIHRGEARRSIATGRMAHLCLANSHFYEGTDFSNHPEVNAVLKDPKNHCILLYPGKAATEITRKNAPRYYKQTPEGKKLVVIVLDATWAQAKRMRRLSENLHLLPQISFLPETPSRFLVRQQPDEHCYSTIEAIHAVIDWMCPIRTKQHENLLEVFAFMVNQQIRYEMQFGGERAFRSTRGDRMRVELEA